MQTISDKNFEGERPLFSLQDANLYNVKFLTGESPLKHSKQILLQHGELIAKYPLWHSDRIRIENSTFTTYSRAAIWYAENISMTDCLIDAPKMFRHAHHLSIRNSTFSDADEMLWFCHDIQMQSVVMKNADYIFLGSTSIRAADFTLQGNYSFDGAKDVVIQRAKFLSKDAFWNSENITVYDCILDGEYLGWYSKNLRLVNCHISGTQPLCHCENLILENCTMDANADLAFEHSTLEATINGKIHSIKNPAGGFIRAKNIGKVFIDNACKNPGGCEITASEPATI